MSKILKSAVLQNASQTSLWLPVFFQFSLTFFSLKSIKCQRSGPSILLSFQQKRMLIPGWHCVVWVNHRNRKVDHLQRLTVRGTYWPPISRPDISFTLSCNAGSHCAMWEGPATFTPLHSPLKNAALGFRPHIYTVCMTYTAMNYLSLPLHPSNNNNKNHNVIYYSY